MTQDNLIDRYQNLYSGVIYDALVFDLQVATPFLLHKSIKPQWFSGDQPKVFGYAFTCQGQKVYNEKDIDDKVRIDMFREFHPNCFQVIATGGCDRVAHFGDISGKIARKFGAVGAVTDGYTRDIEILEKDRFPIFTKGVTPVDAFGKWQIINYQQPIILDGEDGNVTVQPGDGIYGDRDAVIVIPQHLITTVCELAEARLQKEDLVRSELAGATDIHELYERIGRW